MRRIALALLASFAASAQPAAAAQLDRGDFRYVRPLVAASGSGPVLVEPDGALFQRSLPGFSDLRIVDARGHEVPWRYPQSRRGSASEAALVLNSGRQGRFAVALLDLGARRRARDRVELDVPDQSFVGHATVLGADDRNGPFTRLSETGIYDVRGAQAARSTVADFPPSDFRYLLVRATGVSRIVGATVSGARERPRLLRRTIRSISRREDGARTTLTLDLGFRNIPVDELRVAAAATARYERPVAIYGSNSRRRFTLLRAARVLRFPGSSSAPIPVRAHHRYIRIEIENGNDRPLRGIEVSAWSRSRALMIEGGQPPPYTVYYGDSRASAPDYDFARLPTGALGTEHAHGRLGPERVNPAFEPPPDTRSLAARNPWLVTGALALAALALGAVGLLALRRRA